jgi:shikimate kinase
MKLQIWIIPTPCRATSDQMSLCENIFNSLISQYICQNWGVEESIPLKQGLKSLKSALIRVLLQNYLKKGEIRLWILAPSLIQQKIGSQQLP